MVQIVTDYSAQETAREYSDKCEQAAANWKPVADELWRCSGHCEGCIGKREGCV